MVVDDWVSSIRGLQDCILVGSYNNNVQIWNTNRECMTKLSGHNGAVKAVRWISIEEKSNNKEDRNLKFITASQDQSVIVWEWNQKTDKVVKTLKCIGHTESVECLDINQAKSKFISGSWDKMLKLWSLGEDCMGKLNRIFLGIYLLIAFLG